MENAFSDSMIGRDIYGIISVFLGGDKAASEFLHKLGFVGISYPSEYRSGGRTDGARNYVVFDESDLTIVEKARLFKTENGEAYGFTLNGKIYIDPRITTAETPVHEYHHLWAEALEKSNPKAWEHLKSELYKDADLVSWVKERYPDLVGDENALAHELFAKFGGKRGTERLREEQAKAEAENKDGIVGKARIIAMFDHLKNMLAKYWQMARDLFAGNNTRLSDMSANDFADMAMADLMKEVKPDDRSATQTQHTETRFSLPSETEDVSRGDQLFLFDDGMMESSGRRFGLTKEKEGETIEAVNTRFNEELQQQIEGKLPKGHVYDMGMPSDVLLSAGFPNVPIELSSTRLAEKANVAHHPFSLSEMKNLVQSIREPLAVFTYGDKNKSQNVIVEIQHDGKNFVVGIHFNQHRRGIIVSDIRGLYPKDNAEWLNWVSQGKLLYADKEKIQTLIDKQRRTLAEVGYLDLDDVAKIVKDFNNPDILGNNFAGGQRFSLPDEERRAEEEKNASAVHEDISHRGLREIVGEDGYDAFLDDVGRRLRDDVKKEVSSSVGREFLDDVLGVATNAQHTGVMRSVAGILSG